VQAYAATLTAKPPEALTAIHRSITLGGGMTFDDGLALERRLAVALAGTANFQEGIAAFGEAPTHLAALTTTTSLNAQDGAGWSTATAATRPDHA